MHTVYVLYVHVCITHVHVCNTRVIIGFVALILCSTYNNQNVLLCGLNVNKILTIITLPWNPGLFNFLFNMYISNCSISGSLLEEMRWVCDTINLDSDWISVDLLNPFILILGKIITRWFYFLHQKITPSQGSAKF